jgi:hypothetical protein
LQPKPRDPARRSFCPCVSEHLSRPLPVSFIFRKDECLDRCFCSVTIRICKGQACLPVSALSSEIWVTSPQVTCKVALAIQCPISKHGTPDGATTRASNCCARLRRVHGELNVKRLMRAGMVLRDERVRENRREDRIGGRAELEGAWMGTTCRGISRRWIGR